MTPIYLIPLLICCVATWVSLGTTGSLDELPRLLAALVAVLGLIVFLITAPWLIKLSLILILVVFSNFYLKDGFKTR